MPTHGSRGAQLRHECDELRLGGTLGEAVPALDVFCRLEGWPDQRAEWLDVERVQRRKRRRRSDARLGERGLVRGARRILQRHRPPA